MALNASNICLIVFIIIFIVVPILCKKKFYNPLQLRKQSIIRIGNKIEDIHKDDLNERLKAIDSIFLEDKFLSIVWNKYKKTLSCYTTKNGQFYCYSTYSADEFFNTSKLLEGLKKDFWKNLAGIFTGIGILGTFFGLTLGVWGIDMNTSSGLQRGISGLLSGTSTAFVTSIIGIIFAIGFNWLYSSWIKNFNIAIENICENIDSKFTYKKVEDILIWQVEASRKQNDKITELLNAQVEETKAQTAVFKSMSTDLGEIMNETLLNVQDALDQSIESNFKPIFEELLTTLKAFNSNGMEALADSFNDGAGKQILSFAQTLQELEKGMRDVMEQSRIANEESLRQLRQSIEELTQKMNDTIASSVAANTQGTTQNQEAMTALIQKVNETLQQAVTEMAQTTQKGNADFSNTMTLSAEKVQAMVDSIQQTTQSQTTGFTELSSKLKTSLEETVQLIHKDLHDHEVLMGQLLAEIKGILQSSQGLVKEAGVTAGKFTEAATPMRLVAAKMDGQVNTVIDATKTFNQNVKDNVLLLHDSAAKHEQTMTQMEASVEKLASSWKEYEDKFVIVNSNLEKTLTILFENIKRYNDITDAGLKSNLEAFDKHISTNVNSIAVRNDELSNAVSDLSDSIKDLKNIVRTIRR